ncbi:Major cardiolipin synthase ClsA [Paenibacillus auburnensis]|uniref:Cardiolipin synthase n=1 Tax=Paenibacillus auburnensis TaxID=2905649 RepID=A0ABN8FWY8_9BACL|nr:cardiolipin synthase [Paenibacillus auburnensis]CAH1191897.1 Major cardiolipin synthase ClsA [Paenibacillus auburnensis]
MEWGSLFTLSLSLVTILNIILAAVVVFIERRDIGSTWAWLMVLFFIPVVGFLFYIFFGRQLKQRNFYNLTAEERMYLQSAIDEQMMNVDYQGGLTAKYADLLKMNLLSSNAIISSDNEIEIFNDGREKFNSLFEDIRNATQEINVQYYIIQPDELGTRLRDELTLKAKEGVQVRVLYDEIGSKRISRSFFKELIEYGGTVEVFFPSLFRLINFRINNRNHRKLCIIDGEIAYIGGFNVGDEYLGLDKKMGYWRDTHFRIKGGAVDQIQGRFFLDWNKAANRSEKHPEQLPFRTERHTGESVVQIISSGPNSQTEHLKNMYLKLIASAKKSIYIQTPYFVPDASFMDACKIALLSGVDVRIMIPNKPDHMFVYSATLAHAGELLPYGVKILQYEKGFMHAKTIVVDQEIASVGTANIDTRSFRLNFEVNALVCDEVIASQLHDLFLEDSTECSELTLERYEVRPKLAKFKEAVARLLSPIL